MRKISYWSDVEEKSKPTKNLPVGLFGEVYESGLKGSSTENAARGGIGLLEMTTEPLLMGGADPSDYKEGNPPLYESSDVEIDKDVLDLLIFLGDELDNSGEHHLANFADFLIKKFAEDDYNPVKSFNEVLLKVNNSDLANTSEVLKKLTKIFSRTVVLEYMDNKDLDKSKKSAYKKALHRADQYLGES